MKYKHSEEVISKLKENVADLEQKNRKAEEQLFFLKCITSNDSLVTFFTSFPNYQTTMALYEYLDPGVNSKNAKMLSIGFLGKTLMAPPSVRNREDQEL